MVAARPGNHRITLAADKAYDVAEFVADLREYSVTPHGAQNTTTNRRSGIDGRTTRHPGYAVSGRVRKRIEEVFGWTKTAAGFRKTRHRGLAASVGYSRLLPLPTISSGCRSWWRRATIMCEIDSAQPSLRVLQCVDPSAGLRFSVQSRIRASNLAVSLRRPCPVWRLNSPASRSSPNRLLQRAINRLTAREIPDSPGETTSTRCHVSRSACSAPRP
jgi:hypothetical protein